MDSLEFESRLHELKARAHGRWTEILRTLGVDEKVLNKRNQPCPMCGGTDRFQYTDKFGEGNYHCRGCGRGRRLEAPAGLSRLGFWYHREARRGVCRERGGESRVPSPPSVQPKG